MADVDVRFNAAIPVSGGGTLEGEIEVVLDNVPDVVRDYIQPQLVELLQNAISEWPIGPDRFPGYVHSKDRFRLVVDMSSGRLVFRIENPADYTQFIHRPGDKTNLVWERLIAEKIQELRPLLEEGLSDIIEQLIQIR